jgi:hypothetical protein
MKRILFITTILLPFIPVFAQNIGIGTNNPTRAKFEVHGVAGNGYTSAIFGGESTGISLQRNWPSIGFNQYHTTSGSKYMANGAAAVQYLDPVNGGLYFDLYTPGTTNAAATPKRALSIFGSGRVLLGTNFTNSNFTVSRNAGDESTACFLGSSHHSVFNFGQKEDTYIRGGGSGSTVFINDNVAYGEVAIGSGNSFVGINTSNPGRTLDIIQSANTGLSITETYNLNKWEFRVGTDAGLRLFGNNQVMGMFVNPGGQYYTYSDRRRKKNITPLPSLLDKLMQLQPVNYELNDDSSGNKTIGFIAQDVKPLFPELVQVTADSVNGKPMDMHSLNYSGFGPIAIKAIQEQQQIIQKQQADIDELKSIVSELVKQLYHKK